MIVPDPPVIETPPHSLFRFFAQALVSIRQRRFSGVIRRDFLDRDFLPDCWREGIYRQELAGYRTSRKHFGGSASVWFG